MGERQFGPYRLVRQIAVGGMAEIHLAKTKGIAGFEKYVALKMIHPNFAEDEQFIQMLVDEAKIAVQLAHGNIAQTFDLGRVGDTYYITMEYVDGADLYKILRRGSEQDLEMPLDVCAFIAKEIASALDHAHRKKDHTGKPLGIVHRDVSPQNVLISYSGEVKLVDFGIAKATMKARQTAVGVIKGKYYYMSPEQAWGDPIDHRSDIFSAGIVLYEMMTGQMLYLEEDLHKLLDMARKADIAPPSRLRKGIPPQLEKIVMHALQRVPGERYQSAGDFATDLERFLHAYSPVFTAAKVSGLIKGVLGDPQHVVEDQPFPSIEVHEGANATFTLDTNDLVHERGEIHDENSVIFRVDELKGAPKKQPAAPAPAVKPAPAKPIVGAKPGVASPDAPGNRTRAHAPTEPPPKVAPGQRPRPPTGNVGAPMSIPSIKKPQPRKRDEETREIAPAPPGPNDDGSGLLTWQSPEDELENVGERTMITAPGRNFMMDADNNLDGVDATMVTGGPPPRPDTDTESSSERAATRNDDDDTQPGEEPDDASMDGDDEGPTMARDFTTDKPRVTKGPRAPAPAALAAKIHAPAVSELRKPRPSKRTPQGGVAAQPGSVLQAIVAKQASEPMPVPRAAPTPPAPEPVSPPPPQFPTATPGAQPAAPGYQTGYVTDASGLPMAVPTPPAGVPAVGYPSQGYPPGYPQGQPGYPHQAYPPGYYPPQQPGYPPQGYPQQPGYPPQQGYAPPQSVTPGALYQFQPAAQPMSLTGQLRLFEVDEMPSQYKLGASRRRWLAYLVAGVLAVSVAAGVTFLIIRSTRNAAPTTGSVYIESVPAGAEVVFDGTRMTDKTPFTIQGIPVGSRHTVRVELPRHKAYENNEVDIPKSGGDVRVLATLETIPGKLRIVTDPEGAEILINGEPKGRTPKTVEVDMDSAKKLELRLSGYQPFVQDLVWNETSLIEINRKLDR